MLRITDYPNSLSSNLSNLKIFLQTTSKICIKGYAIENKTVLNLNSALENYTSSVGDSMTFFNILSGDLYFDALNLVFFQICLVISHSLGESIL